MRPYLTEVLSGQSAVSSHTHFPKEALGKTKDGYTRRSHGGSNPVRPVWRNRSSPAICLTNEGRVVGFQQHFGAGIRLDLGHGQRCTSGVSGQGGEVDCSKRHSSRWPHVSQKNDRFQQVFENCFVVQGRRRRPVR
jgi:hypothetical protein